MGLGLRFVHRRDGRGCHLQLHMAYVVMGWTIAVSVNLNRRAWSSKDVDDLKRCLQAGMTLGQIANFLERTQADIQEKLTELKLLGQSWRSRPRR